MKPNEKVTLCQTLAWIAFRREDININDPHELRRRMRTQRHLVHCENPAAEFLRVARSGALRVGISNFPMILGAPPPAPPDWSKMTEEDIWHQAEFEWAHSQGQVKVEAVAVPNLRMKWQADDGRVWADDIEDKPSCAAFREWVLTRSKKEQSRIMDNSGLDARQCYRLWRYLGRTDRVPRSLTVFIWQDDVLRLIEKRYLGDQRKAE